MSRSLKNISIVSVATMASRVLGLLRESQTMAVFGRCALTDAFYTAFTLPNLFRRLLGEGALTAALVPTLTAELEERKREQALTLVSQVASWLFVVSGVIVGLGILVLLQAETLAGLAGRWGVDAATGARWVQTAQLMIVLFPYMMLVCAAAAFSAALQTLERFLEPALSPIWLNCAMIGLLWFSGVGDAAGGDVRRMYWLCAGVLLGGVMQLVVPAGALMREGWRPRFDLRLSAPVRAILRLMGPTVFGSAIYLINMAVSRFVGLSLDEKAATALQLATRLMELPIGVFAVAVSTVVFPLISRYAVQENWTGLGEAYRRGMRLILVINIPAAIGLVALAEPTVRVLFQHGKFTASDTAAMVPVFAAYAVGLPFFSFVNLALRAFYAQKDTATPVRAAMVSFAVNLGLSLALMGPLGTVGLALASSAAIVAQAWYLQRHLTRRRAELKFGHLAPTVGKVGLAAVLMGAVVVAGWWGWRTGVGRGFWSETVALAVLIPAGMAAYAGFLWRLKIEGREELMEILRGWRAKLG
ncbi:MAG: murein biosynthesis integral membrane protein MurJ [Opitutae bacterium]|nr:murein biosynthesis integral membrane protein MurJ [Opitutae bacterium]